MKTHEHLAILISAPGLIILILASISIQTWARSTPNTGSNDELIIKVGVDLPWGLLPLFVGLVLPVFSQGASPHVSLFLLGATSFGVIAYLALYYTVIRPSLVKLRMHIRALRSK